MEEDEGAVNQDYSLADWDKIWKENGDKTRGVTEQLLKYERQLLPEEKSSVFLPLCGQSSDLRWLYDRGHSVVGLDGSELPIKALIKRNKDLQFRQQKSDGTFTVWQSADGRMTLYHGNVLYNFVRNLGPFDGVFDYGAYTAIRPSDRQEYVNNVVATLKPSYRYLLEFCHDVSRDCTYGPCSVSFITMRREMGPGKTIKVLETNDLSEEWGAKSFFNSFVLISPEEKKKDKEKKDTNDKK